MDSEGVSQTRRPASTAVERTRRGSGGAKSGGIDVSQHPAAIAYQAAHPKRAIPRFGPYLLLQTLGEGEFGKVKLGLHATWGEEVAVKLIRRGNVENALRMSKVEREIEVLRKINHPNIVRLYDVIETDKYIGIVLEYASGGELFDHILAHRFLRERDACKLFAQLISGVSYIHQKKIVHRDLKLENLLLDRNRNVIITDFGFANRFEHRPDDLMQTSCGSPCYAAPELVISEGEYVGSAVDIWSCGVILYAMLAGYLPFDDDPANPDGDNINLLYKYIVTTPLTFPEYVSQGARDLLGRMLVPDPKHRADLATIMAHPWLAPYAAQFQLSVEQLEQQAIEQQHVKRMAYQRQIRKKQQQQAQSSQAAVPSRATRAQSTRPAAADDSSDLLYTSASPSRRDRAGASAIVLPSPSAADAEMLTVDAPQGTEPAPGERKSRGYRHTIQLEYDVGTRETVPPMPTPSQPISVETPVDAPASRKDLPETLPATSAQPGPPASVRSASASRAAPPSAFAMSSGTRSASASNAEPRVDNLEGHARTGSDDTTQFMSPVSSVRATSLDIHNRAPTNEDGVQPPSVSDASIPAVHVSVPPMSPVDEADVRAALTGGKSDAVRNGSASVNGMNGTGTDSHTPSIRVDGLPGNDTTRSPVMLTPTTIESTGLSTPVATEPATSDVESRPRPPVSIKSTDSPAQAMLPKTSDSAQLPSSIGPVRNASTTSSTGGSGTPRSKSTRHSSKPVEKHADEEVGNTSVSSTKSRRKTLSLMVEPFQRPFRTRTPVEAVPVPERKDSQPLRSAPPSSFSQPPTLPGTAAQSIPPPPAPGPTYKTNTERFMAEGPPVGPASATSKAKRVMNWFRKRSLAPGDSSTPASVPVVSLPPVRAPPAEDQSTQTPRPQIEPKHSTGLNSLSTTGHSSLQLPKPTAPGPVSIVKPSKPVVNRAGMRVHEGAVDQAMVTSGSPLDALAHAEAVLVEMGIAFTKESEFKFRCVRHKKRKGGVSGSVGPLGGLSAGVVGSAASNGVNNRGLPMPPPPSFSGPGGMLRGLLRRSSAQPGTTAEPESSLPEPIYGERNDDAQDEVRFFVELTRIDRLEDTYSIDVRRLKGNLRSYKFLYDTMRERCLPRLQTIN